jgi:mannose-6-phosphate isomerase-like protein (cupin superfamily)
MLRRTGYPVVENILDHNELLAIIVRSRFSEPGIHFFTSNELSQQLAFMKHSSGKTIDPHVHNPVMRQVHYTQEVLVIRKGALRIDFYNEAREYLTSRTLRGGDVILLIKGGHGFFVEEDVEMFEIKQGPYAGDADKTRFTPSSGPASTGSGR